MPPKVGENAVDVSRGARALPAHGTRPSAKIDWRVSGQHGNVAGFLGRCQLCTLPSKKGVLYTVIELPNEPQKRCRFVASSLASQGERERVAFPRVELLSWICSLHILAWSLDPLQAIQQA